MTTCTHCNGTSLPFIVVHHNECVCNDCATSIRTFAVEFQDHTYAFSSFRGLQPTAHHVPTERDVKSNRKCVMCKQYSYFYYWGTFFPPGSGLCEPCLKLMHNFVKNDIQYFKDYTCLLKARRIMAANTIRRFWRKVSTDPNYEICHKLQLRRLRHTILETL